MYKLMKRILISVLMILFITSVTTGTTYAKETAKNTNHTPAITQGASKATTMKEDGRSVTATLNATDADRDSTLSWSIVTKPSQGAVELKSKTNKAGASQIKAVYKPKANYNGTDSYVIQVKDSKGAIDKIKVKVKVLPINDAPKNIVQPEMSEATYVGDVLTTTTGSWSDDKDTQETLVYSYLWQQADDATGALLIDLSNGVSNSYTVGENNLGKYIRVTVTATDHGEGETKSLSESAVSAWIYIEGKNTINYVALGDSIATGTIYPGASITPYVTNIYQYLQKQNPDAFVSFTNLSANGARSNELYQKLGVSDSKLEDLKMIKALQEADLVTISIGGNNLMQAAKDSSALGGYNFNKIDMTIAKQGVVDFNDQWVPIMKKIKEINPTAQIIVNTVFNPYNESDSLYKTVDSFLFGGLEDQVSGINDVIMEYSDLGYSVADVYTAFDEYKTNMGEITYFNPDPSDTMGKLTRNPHPKLKGQDLITELVIDLLK